MQNKLLQFSGFSGAIAVSLGALGAHGLKSKLETGLITESNLQAFDTAVRYQMYHSIALLAMAFLINKLNKKSITTAAYCFMAGIVFFSGSIYILSTSTLLGLENVKWLGPFTPIGGLFFVYGWIMLAVCGIKKQLI
ncbi:MAG TPA: DUF423 domain-containing protein [Bacteroidia bacterium]|nr:DUF423 domain-containing protein [Bacteroidia bacterium]